MLGIDIKNKIDENNKIIRNHIVDVLDGGEKNLRMRLNKYDFNYEEEL